MEDCVVLTVIVECRSLLRIWYPYLSMLARVRRSEVIPEKGADDRSCGE